MLLLGLLAGPFAGHAFPSAYGFAPSTRVLIQASGSISAQTGSESMEKSDALAFLQGRALTLDDLDMALRVLATYTDVRQASVDISQTTGFDVRTKQGACRVWRLNLPREFVTDAKNCWI